MGDSKWSFIPLLGFVFDEEVTFGLSESVHCFIVSILRIWMQIASETDDWDDTDRGLWDCQFRTFLSLRTIQRKTITESYHKNFIL